jgi:uncharacterized RDD family membrane protein YckC
LLTRIVAYHLETVFWVWLLFAVAPLDRGPLWLAFPALLAAGVRAVLTWRFGGTPFKRAFRISVVDYESGQRLSLVRSLLREAPLLLLFPYWLPGALRGVAAMAFFVFYFSDQIMFLARGDRRTLHDLVAGSVVVSDHALPRSSGDMPPGLVPN